MIVRRDLRRAMRVLAAVAALASVIGGCLPRDLDWALSFTDPALAQRAVRAEGSILRGGCEGTEAVYTGDVDQERAPPTLAPGVYGFAARALDIRCLWYAAGCTEVTLPSDDDEVVVRLEPTPEEQDCEGACVEGRCGPQGNALCPIGRADCNGRPEDACEADLGAVSTCGQCGPCEDFEDYCMREANGTHHCEVVCVGGPTACGDLCTDLTADPDNCGGCGDACPVAPNADPVCAASACGYGCRTGFADCDRRSDNGCESEVPCAP